MCEHQVQSKDGGKDAQEGSYSRYGLLASLRQAREKQYAWVCGMQVLFKIIPQDEFFFVDSDTPWAIIPPRLIPTIFNSRSPVHPRLSSRQITSSAMPEVLKNFTD